MPPLPENILFMARKVRSSSGVWAHEWEMQVHIPGAAIRLLMPCAGDYTSTPPSIELLWSSLCQAKGSDIGTAIPSVLS